MPEEEEYPIPKREIEIGRGIMVRREERKEEKKEEEKEEKEREKEAKKEALEEIEKERRRIEEVYKGEGKSPLIYFSIILAILSLLFSGYIFYNLYKMKSELSNVVANLEAFKESTIEIETKVVDINQTGSASVPIREAIPTITIPIQPQEIEMNGTIEVILPGYNFPVRLPWSSKADVAGTLTVNTRNLSEDRRLTIYYEIPVTARMSFKIKGKELINPEMEKAIESLKRMSK